MHVAVIGAGIVGASAARFLAARGHTVTVFEQFEPGHTRGSSHGQSRIVRRAYPDAFYTQIMMEGYPMWAELERASGRKLLRECGLFYFGNKQNPDLQGVFSALKELGIRHEILRADRVGEAIPGLKLQKDEVGVLTTDAGWVPATESVLASLDVARAKGAQIEQKRIETLAEVEKQFDAVVLAPGAWITHFLALDVQPQIVTYCYLEGRRDGAVWIEEGEHRLYGFPSESGEATIKIGAHNVRDPFDPDSEDRKVSQLALELARDFARRRFEMENPEIVQAETCLYALTPDEDFRMGRVGEKIVFASACSGHGFKFGPWVGKLLADMVEGKPGAEKYPRFWVSPRRLN